MKSISTMSKLYELGYTFAALFSAVFRMSYSACAIALQTASSAGDFMECCVGVQEF